ncbi:MAG: FMN-binding protein [Chromatiales bacterium]|nr:FMN-binding protein [Chromatiales bacterium]
MSSGLPIMEKEPSSTTLVAALAIAGFLSGIIIIGVYLATFDTIAENKARELREAVFRVLPNVTRMQKLRYDGSELVVLPDNAKDDEETIYGGYNDAGEFVGYAIVNAGPGFQDTVRVIYGYRPAERKVVGMWILESRETPGLGDKIYKDAAFVANFDNLGVDPEIVAVKKGTKSRANEIDAITGATISSKAVVRIMNEAHKKWDARLPVTAPALQQAAE